MILRSVYFCNYFSGFVFSFRFVNHLLNMEWTMFLCIFYFMFQCFAFLSMFLAIALNNLFPFGYVYCVYIHFRSLFIGKLSFNLFLLLLFSLFICYLLQSIILFLSIAVTILFLLSLMSDVKCLFCL